MLMAVLFLGTVSWCAAQTPEAMSAAHQWVGAKFLGEVAPNPAASYLLVYTQGPVTKNEVEGHHFRIVNRDYSRGLHFSSDGTVRVMLAGPAKSFEAVVGVDSNDIGYYSNVGRGAVVASVQVAGKTPFRTEVLHEGMAGVPVKVDLENATEFDLKVQDGGGGVVFGNHFDQADWAEARVTMADGSTVWLGDLPTGPRRAPLSAEVPFSFRYGDRPSSYLLKMWELNRSSRRVDENRTEHTLTYTDPKSGLVVRCVAVEYKDFPVVEWTLYFRNTGASPTPILENIQALDTRLRARRGRRIHSAPQQRLAGLPYGLRTFRRPPGTQTGEEDQRGGRPSHQHRHVLLQYRLAGRRRDCCTGLAGPMGGTIHSR